MNSETSALILDRLSAKAHEVTEIEAEVEICRHYIPEKEAADFHHAAAALHSKAVLISNDKHFDKIRDAGIIKVWSISEAVRRLSVSSYYNLRMADTFLL